MDLHERCGVSMERGAHGEVASFVWDGSSRRRDTMMPRM